MDLYHSLWFMFVFQMSMQSGPDAYVPFFNTAPLSDSPTSLGINIRVVVDGYIFSCSGTISQWQAYVIDNGSHPIEFHVWRRELSVDDTVLSLVGSNAFSNAVPTGDLLILDVPPEERIDVEAGDLVGIRSVRNNDTEDNFQIQTLLVGLSTYYTMPNDEDTPSVLMLTGRFHLQVQVSPLINVVFVSDQPNAQGISVREIVAIAVTVFVFIVAVFIVIVVVCCLKALFKRKRIDPDTDMEHNRAYASTTTCGNIASSSEETRPQNTASYVEVDGTIYDQIN